MSNHLGFVAQFRHQLGDIRHLDTSGPERGVFHLQRLEARLVTAIGFFFAFMMLGSAAS